MKIYVLGLTISSLFFTGCFTVPGKDRIITVDSCINNQGATANHPLNYPTEYVEYIPADQSIKAKLRYINQCMINYSWGSGWNDRTDFKN